MVRHFSGALIERCAIWAVIWAVNYLSGTLFDWWATWAVRYLSGALFEWCAILAVRYLCVVLSKRCAILEVRYLSGALFEWYAIFSVRYLISTLYERHTIWHVFFKAKKGAKIKAFYFFVRFQTKNGDFYNHRKLCINWKVFATPQILRRKKFCTSDETEKSLVISETNCDIYSVRLKCRSLVGMC